MRKQLSSLFRKIRLRYMPRTYEYSPEQVNAIYARGDRLIKLFLLIHGGIALALAPFYATWLSTLVVGGAAISLFFLADALAPRTLVTRCIAGIALQTFV